jgi:MYXO-CTERM domain-containing protein
MPKLKLFCAALALCASSSGHAVVAYSEAISGDLSGVGTSPTFVTVANGSNQVLGSTGNPGTGVDRDYFTISVPAGSVLASLKVLAGTAVLGGVSFIGLQAGNQFTVPFNQGTAAGMLGWTHYAPADAGVDILPRMATSGAGASGFTAPLPAGAYSFWIQDFGAGTASYSFELNVAAVPEAPTAAVLLAGLAMLGLRRLRSH